MDTHVPGDLLPSNRAKHITTKLYGPDWVYTFRVEQVHTSQSFPRDLQVESTPLLVNHLLDGTD